WTGKASNLSIQPRAGGCFCESGNGLQTQVMVVSFVDPGKLMRMQGGLGPLQGMGLNGTREWRFSHAKSAGTQITLGYCACAYTQDDLRKLTGVVDQVLGQMLGGLGSYLKAKK